MISIPLRSSHTEIKGGAFNLTHTQTQVRNTRTHSYMQQDQNKNMRSLGLTQKQTKRTLHKIY